MGNFMPDCRSQFRQDFFIAHLAIIDGPLSVSAQNVYAVRLRLVAAIEIMRHSGPFILIHRV